MLYVFQFKYTKILNYDYINKFGIGIHPNSPKNYILILCCRIAHYILGDIMDKEILESIEKINEIIEEYIEQYSLEEMYTEECPRCGKEISFYQSKYNDNISISFCGNCYELIENIDIDSNDESICNICDELIKFEEEDNNNYVICSYDDCNQKVHKTCVEHDICDKCRIWACDDHYGHYIECDRCKSLHKITCINELTPISSQDKDENVCNNCFYRDEDVINEIKRPFENYKDVEHEIDENRDFYIGEAMENFDLTIMVTHLIKSETPLDILIKILEEKKLRASETGYYKHTDNTKSVCFADLTIRGLKRHSEKYSIFSIGFLKGLIFEKNGAPALYIRDNLIRTTEEVNDHIKPYVNKINLTNFDFHHEREWRVPDDFEFEYNEVFVVFAPTKHHDNLRRKFSDISRFLDLDILQLI